jgi:hypothetical protein
MLADARMVNGLMAAARPDDLDAIDRGGGTQRAFDKAVRGKPLAFAAGAVFCTKSLS